MRGLAGAGNVFENRVNKEKKGPFRAQRYKKNNYPHGVRAPSEVCAWGVRGAGRVYLCRRDRELTRENQKPQGGFCSLEPGHIWLTEHFLPSGWQFLSLNLGSIKKKKRPLKMWESMGKQAEGPFLRLMCGEFVHAWRPPAPASRPLAGAGQWLVAMQENRREAGAASADGRHPRPRAGPQLGTWRRSPKDASQRPAGTWSSTVMGWSPLMADGPHELNKRVL